MPTVVGVKLRFAPKALFFDPAGTEPVEGDSVVVETERGTELGLVVKAAHEIEPAELPAPLKPVTRVATEEDIARAAELAELEREAMPVFRELVEAHKLDMKPIDVEYLFGGDKVVFYFVAEERVDFRDLVKELASRFKSRIDMRQVGVRDEARMVGGLGHCGEQLCCVRFGGEFQPVSIRMAKEQDLPLNPLKISGLCGRLMCCLRYEYEAYKDYKSRAPKRGAIVETPIGLGKVTDLNTPHETVELRLEDGKRYTVPLAEMTCSKGAGCPCAVSRETLEVAGGAGAALAFAALDREAEAAAAPPKPERPAREPRERRERKAAGEAPEAREAEQAPAPKGDGGRRRRRRGGGGGKGGEAAEKPAAAPQAKPAAAAQPSEGGSAGPGRRRRRRRGGGEGSAPQA